MNYTRQQYNLEICDMLTEFFSKPENKDVRFFQALAIFGVVEYTKDGSVKDPFNKESKETNDSIYKFISGNNG